MTHSTNNDEPHVSIALHEASSSEKNNLALHEEKLLHLLAAAVCVIDRNMNVLFSNAAHGRIYDIEPEVMIGKSIRDFSEQGFQNASRDFRYFDVGKVVDDHEFYHKGTYYWVSVIPLKDQQGLVYAILVTLMDIGNIKEIEYELKKNNNILQTYSETDFLTELYNRRAFDDILHSEIKHVRRSKSNLALIIFDIDNFKQYNDFYGHLAGDDVLKAVAMTSKAVLQREDDVICRYGGEEFAVILPATDMKGAVAIAERIKANVIALDIRNEKSPIGLISVSLGVYTMGQDAGYERLIKSADQALYKAKKTGKNKVEVYQG